MSGTLQHSRHQSPSSTSGTHYDSQPLSAPSVSTTRPQFSRPGLPPNTLVGSAYAYPSENTLYAAPNTAPLGPSRPQRSELRNRNDYPPSDHASTPSQDKLATQSNFLGTSYRNYPVPERNAQNGSSLTQRDPRLGSPVQDNADQTSPNSLSSALAAFQSAGARRRRIMENEEDYQHQTERERELQAEKVRQQRIRDKAPGMKNKITKAGEIDGARPRKSVLSARLPRTN